MPIKVAYLGPEGTNAEKAAHELSKLENFDDPIFIPCIGLHSVVEEAATNRCEAAVVPIENSVEGGVTATLDALWSFKNLFIKKALVLPIRHSLFASGELKDISEVLSHPQALAQCSEWLKKNLPNALQLPTSSTAEAVKIVMGCKFRAAIASKNIINQKNINELASPINDVPGNCTRFILLQRERNKEHLNLFSIAFSLNSNLPGALLEALSCIADLGLNMSRIESRPSKRELGEYVFFIDLESKNQDIFDPQSLIKRLRPLCDHLIDLGSYENLEIK